MSKRLNLKHTTITQNRTCCGFCNHFRQIL